jgi:hypothetical protein
MTDKLKGYTTTATGEVFFDLDRRVEQIDTMSDWKLKLDAELVRAEVLRECGLLSDEHFDALDGRVQLWCDAAKKLTPKERKGGA